MKADWLNRKVEKIRSSMLERSDGGPGSGNWGHVGRPGEPGGSQKGGGKAFRMVNVVKNTYTSQPKIRQAAKQQYKNAKLSGSAKLLAKAQKRMKSINTNIKTADVRKAGKKGYQVVNEIDENASRNILKDKKRGKSARENNLMKVKGTNETIKYTFPNRVTRGGSGKRGGKTTVRRAKN